MRALYHDCCKGKKRGDILSPRTGRPLKENPRNINLNIRISQEEAIMIQECADDLQTTRTDVIVEGIRMVKEKFNKKKVTEMSPTKATISVTYTTP